MNLTVEHAVQNVIKQIDSKPVSINVSFENAVNNLENRIGRPSSVSDNFTTVSITGYVNEAEGYTDRIYIEDTFSKLRRQIIFQTITQAVKKALVIKALCIFQFDKELVHFDKNS